MNNVKNWVKKWDQNDVVAVSVLILQFSSWISNIKLDIELLARFLFLDDLKDFEIFPRVDVGSFKPLHINRPQNSIAMIIRTQIPIKPAIKLFWFFKSASVKSEIKDTFLLDFHDLRLPGKAMPEHYENKFTKTFRPTDILHVFTKS